MDVIRHHPRRAGAANGGDIENRAILDRVDLRGELIFVAVFLEISLELNGFEEAVPLRADLIDRNVLRPAEVSVDTLQILGRECDFHDVVLPLMLTSMQRSLDSLAIGSGVLDPPGIGGRLAIVLVVRNNEIGDVKDQIAGAAIADRELMSRTESIEHRKARAIERNVQPL